VRKGDSLTVRQLKLKVIASLAAETNAEQLLNELASYTGSINVDFAASAVSTMGKIALRNPDIIPYCLVTLLKLMTRAEGHVLAEVVVVIAHILRQRRGTDDEAQALRQLCRKFILVKDANARAAVLSVVGDMHETHPEFAPQLLRYIAQNIESESGEVRIQALTLSAKLLVAGTDSKVPNYLLKFCERDTEFDVRDRARFLLALLETKNEKMHGKLRSLLFPERKAPVWSSKEVIGTEYQIGTFSQFFGKEASGYEPLPEWVEESEIPDESVRIPVRKSATGEVVQIDDEVENLDVNSFFGDSGDEGVLEEKGSEEGEYYDYEDEEDGYASFGASSGKIGGGSGVVSGGGSEEKEEDDLDDFFG
jgi:AP-3 complex subunit beta